jgi:uncharacterized membrane protein YqhA
MTDALGEKSGAPPAGAAGGPSYPSESVGAGSQAGASRAPIFHAEAPGTEVSGAQARPHVPPAGHSQPHFEGRFEQVLSLSRIAVVVPVIVLLLSALASFAYGTDVFIRSVANVVDDPHITTHNIGFLLLLTDLFLVGATLMIAAFGLYELFITRIDSGRPGMRLPGWLRMHDLNDLKARVISMIILVAAVTFVDVVVETEPDGGLNTFYLGSGVAVVIAALTAFIRFGRVDGSDS